MRNKIQVYNIIFLFSIIATPLWAGHAYEITPTWHKNSHTTYQIGGQTSSGRARHFPISELKFPIRGPSIEGKLSLELNPTLYIDLHADHSLGTSLAGKMKDSDWGIELLNENNGAPTSRLEIYSESDAHLTSLGAGIQLRQNVELFSTVETWLGIGYDVQQLDYSVKNVKQVYLTDYLIQHASYGNGQDTLEVPGKVLAYKATFYKTYISFMMVKKWKHWELAVCPKWAPYVVAKDQDDHILRSKRSTGEATGDGIFFESWMTYKTASKLKISVGFKHAHIETEGEQEQYYYGGRYIGYRDIIDQKIISKQDQYMLKLGYEF